MLKTLLLSDEVEMSHNKENFILWIVSHHEAKERRRVRMSKGENDEREGRAKVRRV